MDNSTLKRMRSIQREQRLEFGRRLETRHILSLKEKDDDPRKQRKSRSWQKDWQ